MMISVITTVYNSASHITEFISRSEKVLKTITDDYEIVIVNDGSPDNSFDIVKKIAMSNKKIVLIDLSRNFGHHKALMAGLSYASGEFVFLIDSDLEEEPELLLQFWEKFKAVKSIDVVFGVQRSRKGGALERVSGWIFYYLFNLLSPTKITPNLSTIRLMSRAYVNSVLKYIESEIFLAGIMELAGFNQVSMPIYKGQGSASTYSMYKKINLFIDCITSFSQTPLVAIFNVGILTTLFSVFYILYLVIRKLFFSIAVEGWSTVVASIWLVGGITIFSLGIIGIYLSKMFVEVKRRPRVIIKEIVNKDRSQV